MKLIKKLGTKKDGKRYLRSYGLFLCSYCLKEVEKQLTYKNCKSCGCNKGKNNKNAFKHGYEGTRIYKIYYGMKNRCYNINDLNYKNYGGRGITICDEWLDKETGFINFRDWALTHGYKDNLTIDRINNDLGYSPENCQWITKIENNRNKRNIKMNMKKANEIRIKYKTDDYTQQQLADEYKIAQQAISNIINNKRWEGYGIGN